MLLISFVYSMPFVVNPLRLHVLQENPANFLRVPTNLPSVSLWRHMNRVLTLFSTSATMSEPHTQACADSPDGELLSLIKRGNHSALSEILRRYESPLIGFLCGFTGDRASAEELVQDTFLKLIKRPPFMLSGGSLKPWLFRVAGNLAKDFKRRQSRLQTVETIPEEAESSHTRLGNKQDTEYYLAQLPEDIRMVVSLRIYGDLSYQEIANQMKIPVGTATWRMKHGLDTLRKFINPEAQ